MSNQPRYRLTVRATITDQHFGGGLTVEETVDVRAEDFLELARILGQFHDLAQRLKVVSAR